MKLGDKVKFSMELVKQPQQIDISENSGTWHLWFSKEHKTTLTGIVCGIRTIAETMAWTRKRSGLDGVDDYIEKTHVKVYLIATNLRGFHRVPEEWLEPIEGDTFLTIPQAIKWITNENIIKLNELEQRHDDWEELAEECRAFVEENNITSEEIEEIKTEARKALATPDGLSFCPLERERQYMELTPEEAQAMMRQLTGEDDED